jgi:ABC-2 type transport system permease protein
MHLRMILAIMRKDTREILLNTTTLVALISPLILAVIFVVLTNFSLSGSVEILVYNPDHSEVEQILTSTFENPKIIYVQSPELVSSAFGEGDQQKDNPYTLGLIIPPGMKSALQNDDHLQISLYVNGNDIGEAQARLMEAALEGILQKISSPQLGTNIRLIPSPPYTGANPLEDFKKFLVMANLVGSLFIGAAFVPSLIVEEKEKQTIRLLRNSGASWVDVVGGKALVGLGYQILVALAILLIQGGFTGQVAFVLLFTLLGAVFAVAVGLLAGSILKTGGAVGAFVGMISLFFLFPAFFISSFTPVISNPILRLVELLPTYFLAEGLYNAMINHVMPARNPIDLAIPAGYAVLFMIAGMWRLRRQARM